MFSPNFRLLQGSCGQEKSGFGVPVVRTNNDIGESQENGRQSQDFRIFYNMEVNFGQNGLTFIAVIFTVNNKMKTSSLAFNLQKYIGIITALS